MLPLTIITVRILPPEGEESNEVMDAALAAVESMGTTDMIARFVQNHVLTTDALAGFTVEVEYDQ